jgi:hypothetical protein
MTGRWSPFAPTKSDARRRQGVLDLTAPSLSSTPTANPVAEARMKVDLRS